MTYYKSLTANNKGPYSDFDFTPYLPKDGEPGPWLPTADDLFMCRTGWHCADEDHIIQWLNDNIFEVEIRGEMLEESDKMKVCAREMRLVRHCDGWNDRTERLFACDCAERVLPIFEKVYPKDKRPCRCIEIARKFANGEARTCELNSAEDSAGDSAWDAAWAAARAAAWDATRDAARAAAGAAAGAAARDATWDAAWAAARAAAWDATRDAAGIAARDAAWATAWDAEREWQNKKLLELLK